MKRFSTAERFWKDTLELVIEGNGEVMLGVPSELFDIMELNGEHTDMPVWQKNELESDLRELSSFWGEAQDLSASEVLINALSSTYVGDKALDTISEVLAKCTMVTPSNGVRISRQDKEKGVRKDMEPEPEANAVGSEPETGGPCESIKPSEIYEYLNNTIVSQDAAKRCASMIMYDHFRGRRSVSVFAGPTGSGKTEIFRLLKKKYPDDVRIVDASRLSAEGYKGSFHLRDIFEGISPERIARRGLVVVLDEADKLFCETHVGSAGTDYSAMIQGQLLRMMDGDSLEFSSDGMARDELVIDCSGVSVVLLGAFENLLEAKSESMGSGLGFTGTGNVQKADYSSVRLEHSDLMDAGMRTEIAGRVERIVQLKPLGTQDMEGILLGNVIPEMEKELGAKIVLSEESVSFLTEKSVENGLGARYLRSVIRNALDELIFDDPDGKDYRIELSA